MLRKINTYILKQGPQSNFSEAGLPQAAATPADSTAIWLSGAFSAARAC